MCDYSLEHAQSRPAVVGDKLVTTVFPNSITRGFAAVDGPQAEYGGVLRHIEPVCLRPGTELVFEENVKADHALGFFPTKVIEHTTAIFRQIYPDMPHQHHDSLEFPNGRIVLLTRLLPGQKATVLQLPHTVAGDPETETPVEAEPAPAEQPAEAPAEPTVTEPVA